MKWVSFSSLPKETLHVSVPVGLRKPFQEWLKESGVAAPEFFTYYICKAIGRDPTQYGLHELRDDDPGGDS